MTDPVFGETVSRVAGTRAYHEAVAHAKTDDDAELEKLALTISPVDAYRRPQMLTQLVQGTLRLLAEKRETR